jgi:hypothetical protein
VTKNQDPTGNKQPSGGNGALIDNRRYKVGVPDYSNLSTLVEIVGCENRLEAERYGVQLCSRKGMRNKKQGS